MMKVLFVCGASVSGGTLRCPGWVRGMLPHFDDTIEVTILSDTGSAEQGAQTLTVDGKAVGLIPAGLWNAPDRFAPIAKDADVIVVFGTESAYTLPVMRLSRDAGALEKTVLFAQGMACACAKHYAEGVPERIVRRKTFRDLLRRVNIRTEQKRMEARAADEREAIAMTRHFMGRTTFDHAVLRMYNPDAAYYKCNDIMRSGFYEGQWRYDACEPHRIFVSQYYYPLKGFHYLLEAASLLIQKYPDLTIAAAGYNPILREDMQNEAKDSSYIRYVKELVRRYGLAGHIELCGMLDEEHMKAEYLKANVFVLPSTIENSPNSLGEAMLLGVPCVAADVGGVSDFADHRREAYLYPSSAAYLLAHYIDRLFADPSDAARLGANAKKRAEADYDRDANIRTLQDAFRAIAQKK